MLYGHMHGVVDVCEMLTDLDHSNHVIGHCRSESSPESPNENDNPNCVSAYRRIFVFGSKPPVFRITRASTREIAVVKGSCDMIRRGDHSANRCPQLLRSRAQ